MAQNVKIMLFLSKVQSKTLFAFKFSYFIVFQLKGNVDLLDFFQKKFYNIVSRRKKDKEITDYFQGLDR